MLGVLVFGRGGGSSESNKPHAAYRFAIWCKGVKGYVKGADLWWNRE